MQVCTVMNSMFHMYVHLLLGMYVVPSSLRLSLISLPPNHDLLLCSTGTSSIVWAGCSGWGNQKHSIMVC